MKKAQPQIPLASGAVISALLTFLVFFTALGNQFVALDDFEYVLNNSHIKTFDWSTVWWAFTSFYQGNWHPLAMISLALDLKLWGLAPFGYHLTNLLLHTATAFVVCYLYHDLLKLVCSRRGETDKSPRSIIAGAVVATLFFALHPLRVESVAWISERKDVLCILFMVSAIWFYLKYSEKLIKSPATEFWRISGYWWSLFFAALAMMSKPTAVSLPLIFCIIDFYPVGRWSGRGNFLRSNVDKIPFVIFSLILSVLTMFAQQVAMKVFDELDLLSRFLVACKAVFFYLVKTIWPSDLAAFYVHPGNVASTAPGEYLIYVFLVAALFVAAVVAGRRSKMWPVLLCYYFVTIAPMLGIIQVGGQWVADRYSYLPALGLSLLWGGGTLWLVNNFDSKRATGFLYLSLALVISQLLIYTFLTIRQIAVWSDTETLATRIITLQPDTVGPGVYYARAIHRNHAGQYQRALSDIGMAMKIALRQNYRPLYAKIAFEQALILKNLGRLPEAATVMEWGMQCAVESPPDDAVALFDELKRGTVK